MKSKLVLLLLFFCASIFAGSIGPSLTGVTQYLLMFAEEDGRWNPKKEWTIKGLNAGEELKTALIDEKGKTVAFAIWNYSHNYDGDWSKATSISKFGPAGHPDNDYPNVPRIKEGKYKLEISASKKLIWQTDFEIVHLRYFDKEHYWCTGPWKSVAYVYCCGQYSGAVINFWFEGPKDLDWYNKTNNDYERMMELKTEIKNESGTVLIAEGPAQYDGFVVNPGRCQKYAKSAGNSKPDFEQKVLSADGKYDLIVYAGGEPKGGWTPIVILTFTVKNREILINEALSGQSSDPVHRLITTSAYYQADAVKNIIPKYSL